MSEYNRTVGESIATDRGAHEQKLWLDIATAIGVDVANLEPGLSLNQDLGVDSLAMVEMAAVCAGYGAFLTEDDLVEIATVEDLAQAIKASLRTLSPSSED